MRVLDWFRKQAKWIEEQEDFWHLQNVVWEGIKKHYTGKHKILDEDAVYIQIYEEAIGVPSGVTVEYDLYGVNKDGDKYLMKHVARIYKFDFNEKFNDHYYRCATFPCGQFIRNSIADRVYACKSLEDLSKLNILDITEVSKRVEPVATEIIIDPEVDYDIQKAVVGIVSIHKFIPRWNDTFDEKYSIFKSYIFQIPFGQQLLMDISSHMDELVEHSYFIIRKVNLFIDHTFRVCSISGKLYNSEEDEMASCEY